MIICASAPSGRARRVARRPRARRRSSVVEDDAGDERADEAGAQTRRRRRARAPGTSTAPSSAIAGCRRAAQRGREREPVDGRRVDRGISLVGSLGSVMHCDRLAGWRHWAPARRKRGSVGRVSADRRRPDRQREQAGDERDEDRRAPPAAGRAPRRVTAGRGLRCSTAEISRSMYIAASTIATAPTTAQPQPAGRRRRGSGTRPRTRRSPARRAR